MSNNKDFTGNFYQTDEVEKMPDECPNCLYKNQQVEKKPDECPNCYYTPNKNDSAEKK